MAFWNGHPTSGRLGVGSTVGEEKKTFRAGVGPRVHRCCGSPAERAFRLHVALEDVSFDVMRADRRRIVPTRGQTTLLTLRVFSFAGGRILFRGQSRLDFRAIASPTAASRTFRIRAVPDRVSDYISRRPLPHRGGFSPTHCACRGGPGSRVEAKARGLIALLDCCGCAGSGGGPPFGPKRVASRALADDPPASSR